MKKRYQRTGQPVMNVRLAADVAIMLHEIGFRAGHMQVLLRQLVGDDLLTDNCPDPDGSITTVQMAELDRAISRAGYYFNTAVDYLFPDRELWERIFRTLQGDGVVTLPRPPEPDDDGERYQVGT